MFQSRNSFSISLENSLKIRFSCRKWSVLLKWLTIVIFTNVCHLIRKCLCWCSLHTISSYVKGEPISFGFKCINKDSFICRFFEFVFFITIDVYLTQLYRFHWSAECGLSVLIFQRVFFWCYTGIQRFSGGGNELFLLILLEFSWFYVSEKLHGTFSFKCFFTAFSFPIFITPVYRR